MLRAVEVVCMDVGTSQDGAFRLSFLRSLSARNQGGVGLMISDALLGLTDATAAVFARASWQRCRKHFMTSTLTRVRGGSSPGESDAADAHRVPAAVTGRLARGACACRRSTERSARRCRPMLDEAGVDCRCSPASR